MRIYDEGESHGVRFLVMEYIEGRTVGQMIVEHGRLPPGTAADIARQVSLGLDHLHQKGLLHRDVNPMNILIDRHGTAKLTDLGLAIDTGDADDIVTRDGATVGTFDYISPEQAKHSRAADMRSDVYSLGCTLYHMITGQVPFPLPSLPEKLYAHQLVEPEPISSLVPGVPEGLIAIVRKSMRKLPEERHARPIDLAQGARALRPRRDPAGQALTRPGRQHPHAVPGPAPAAGRDGRDPGRLRPRPGPESGRRGKPAAHHHAGKRAGGLHPENRPRPAHPPVGHEARLGAADRPESVQEIPLVAPDKPVQEARPTIDMEPGRFRKYALAGTSIVAVFASIVLAWAMRDRIGRLFRGGSPSHQSRPDDEKGTSPNAVELANGDVMLRFPNGQEESEASLRGAIERSAGRAQSEIVIRAKTPIQAGEPGKTLLTTWGQMVIRAGKDVQPELVVNLSGRNPWIEVGPQASLKLVGLRIRIEVAEKGGEKPPILIQANGNVEFERCTFVTTGTDRGSCVVAAECLEMRMTGCGFDGFDRPLRLTFYAGADHRLTQCLFIRDPAANPAMGWAISALKEAGQGGNTRKLAMDHCTVVGAGLLVSEGFDAANPLEVSVQNSVIKARAMVMTAPEQAESVGKVVRWKGVDNWYQISDSSWAVVLPQGFPGPPGMPSDLKSWSDRMGGESGGREDPIAFAGSSQGEGRPIEDFAAKVEAGKPPVGIDPASVGPNAKPGKP